MSARKKIRILISIIALFITCGLLAFGFPYYQTQIIESEQSNFLDSTSKPIQLSWNEQSSSEKIIDDLYVLLKSEKTQKISTALSQIKKAIGYSGVVVIDGVVDEKTKKIADGLSYQWSICEFLMKKIAYDRLPNTVALNDLKAELQTLKDSVRTIRENIDTNVDKKNTQLADQFDTVSSGIDVYSPLIAKLIDLNVDTKPEDGKSKAALVDEPTRQYQITHEQLLQLEPILMSKSRRLFEAAQVDGLQDHERWVLINLAYLGMEWLGSAHVAIKEYQQEDVFIVGHDFNTMRDIAGEKDPNLWRDVLPAQSTKDVIADFSTVLTAQSEVSKAIVDNHDSFLVYQQAKKFKTILANSIGDDRNIIWYGGGLVKKNKGIALDEIANKTGEMTSIFERFSYLNSITFSADKHENIQNINNNILEVLGELKVSESVPSDDGQNIKVKISSIDSNFMFWVNLPLEKDHGKNIDATLKLAKPIAVFTLVDESLVLTDISLDIDRVIGTKLNIKIPVSFSEKSARGWEVAFQKRENERKETALKLAAEQERIQRDEQKKYEATLMQDPVYAQARQAVSTLRNTPACQYYSHIILQWASPKAGSEDLRAQAVDRIIDKVPEYCFN